MYSHFSYRLFCFHLQLRALRETLQQPELTEVRATPHMEDEKEDSEEEYGENEPIPDLEKDDMVARRTRSFQNPSEVRANQCFSQFLPVPGSVKYNVNPESAALQPRSQPKVKENTDRDRYCALMEAACDAGQQLQLTKQSFTGRDEALIVKY